MNWNISGVLVNEKSIQLRDDDTHLGTGEIFILHFFFFLMLVLKQGDISFTFLQYKQDLFATGIKNSGTGNSEQLCPQVWNLNWGSVCYVIGGVVSIVCFPLFCVPKCPMEYVISFAFPSHPTTPTPFDISPCDVITYRNRSTFPSCDLLYVLTVGVLR